VQGLDKRGHQLDTLQRGGSAPKLAAPPQPPRGALRKGGGGVQGPGAHRKVDPKRSFADALSTARVTSAATHTAPHCFRYDSWQGCWMARGRGKKERH
jgi:hypothetical protein